MNVAATDPLLSAPATTTPPTVVIEPRGGAYSEGPAQAFDFQEPYLRQLLGFIGVTEVLFIRVERIGYGPDVRAASIAGAQAQLANHLASTLGRAA